MVTSSHPEFHAEVVVPMSEADAAVAAATYMPLHVTILEFLLWLLSTYHSMMSQI